MKRIIGKRKASSQLTPQNMEREDYLDIKKNEELNVDQKNVKVNEDQVKSSRHENFKGIFASSKYNKVIKNSLIHEDMGNKEKLIASLNQCFYKTITEVLEVDNTKNLKYLLKQYREMISKIQSIDSENDILNNSNDGSDWKIVKI